MKTSFQLALFISFSALSLSAAERTFVVATDDSLINHWPGADGLLGTADDPVDANPSAVVGSDPNAAGTYGFMVTVLDFISSDPEPYLFDQWNTTTYVEGSATIDTDAFLADGVPLLTSINFNGTQLFQFHGLYSLSMTSPTGGTYSRSGHVFTFSSTYDFEGTFAAGFAMTTDATAEGTAILIDATDYGAPDLSAAPAALADYVTNVAIPLAQARSASGLLVSASTMVTTGSEGNTPAFFPPLNAYGVSVALEFAAVAEEVRFTGIGIVPEGVRLEWSEIAGRTYTVEAKDSLAGMFATIASNLTTAEFIDTEFTQRSTRYYRIKLE